MDAEPMESWGRALYGDPCLQCGYDWSISPQEAVELVTAVHTNYTELLTGTDGTQRHPDLDWTAGAYVCHVTDNLRIWAERLAGAALGGTREVYRYDENLLARLEPEHPLQRRVRETSAELTGVEIQHTAIDGCGAPLFGTTVRGLATAFRRMVRAAHGEPAYAVAAAMREHPFYVGGSPHANTDVMRLVPGALAKGGAEGVIAVCAASGAAVAMKVIDGSPRATTLIALRVLEWLGTDIAAAHELVVVPVLGGGVPVGGVAIGSALAEAMGLGIERRL
jgi:hypothetical protein